MDKQKIKKKASASVIAIIGFLLSPVSWWNDIFISIPIAYVLAIPFGIISKSFFLPAMVLFYWLTNIVGLLLMHNGIKGLISDNSNKNTKKELFLNILFSIGYTLLIVVLVYFGILPVPLFG